MITEKFGTAIMAFFNKIANAMFSRDPAAVLQLEVDRATARIGEARKGLEMQRGLVEATNRRVAARESEVVSLTAQIKSHLAAGNRERAGELVLLLGQANKALAENQANRDLHEASYQNFLLKVQKGTKDVLKLQDKATKMVADLKMSEAEVEISRVAESLNTSIGGVTDITSNLGKIENVIQGQIDRNKGKVRVAADLSGHGVEEIKAEQRAEKFEAEDMLRRFEADMGITSPESTPVKPVADRVVGTSKEA